MTAAQLTPAWSRLVYVRERYEAAICPARFVLIAAGRGSGKTEISKRKLVASLRLRKPWPDPRYFYGAPTQEQAERIAWDDLLRLIPPHWIAADGISLSESRITTVFGSSVSVVGLDKPQRIEGVQWDGGVVDEMADIKPRAFDLNIRPALTWRHGWCWRQGVPKRFGIGAKEFRESWMGAREHPTPDLRAFTWDSEEVLAQIDPTALTLAKEHMDPRDYNEQYRARWESAAGLVFYTFNREIHASRQCAYDPARPLHVGADFNVDPMAWVIGQAKADDVFEWIDELWLRNTNTLEALDTLYRRYQSHKAGFVFYLDAASGQRRTSSTETDYRLVYNHAFLKAAGRRIAFPLRGGDGKLEANPAIEARFAACNAKFLNAAGRVGMYVDPKCKRLIADLEGRAYKPGTRDADDSGDVGHISDAMGYAIHKLYPLPLAVDRGRQTVIISAA